MPHELLCPRNRDLVLTPISGFASDRVLEPSHEFQLKFELNASRLTVWSTSLRFCNSGSRVEYSMFDTRFATEVPSIHQNLEIELREGSDPRLEGRAIFDPEKFNARSKQ